WTATRDAAAYPLEKILDLVGLATARDPANLAKFIERISDENEMMRYWAVLGCLMLNEKAAPAKENLIKATEDRSPHVRVVAAEALCRIGDAERGLAVLSQHLLKHENAKVRLQAANSLDHLGIIAKPAWAQLKIA